MLDQLKQRRDNIIGKKEGGFTIVEVMIVLAIAGLIILIVFLAVPALQRSSRNTQRSNDASLVGAAINDCLTSRNGITTSCDTQGELAPYYDATKLRQMPTVAFASAMPANNTTINYTFGNRCSAAGDALGAAGAARAAVLLYNTESGTGGNIARCQEV